MTAVRRAVSAYGDHASCSYSEAGVRRRESTPGNFARVTLQSTSAGISFPSPASHALRFVIECTASSPWPLWGLVPAMAQVNLGGALAPRRCSCNDPSFRAFPATSSAIFGLSVLLLVHFFTEETCWVPSWFPHGGFRRRLTTTLQDKLLRSLWT